MSTFSGKQDGSPATPNTQHLDTMPLLSVHNLSKRFPGVQALQGVSVEIAEGSCHALMGENGAGKSTLGKILAGIYQPDEGEIQFQGAAVHFHGPQDAVSAGISMVHQ